MRDDDPEGLFSDEWTVEYVRGFYAGRTYERSQLVKNPRPIIEDLLKEMNAR